MRHRCTTLVIVVLALVAILATALVESPGAVADPATVTAFSKQAAATRYTGAAFDACSAPPLSTMIAWGASPYRALGVYVGGPNRSCTQPNLTAAWVGSVTSRGWKLLPVYMGRQAPCSSRPKAVKITASKTISQGKASADDAIATMTALGLQPGSIVYADMENYQATNAACRTAVIGYLSAFTRELHRLGYLSGVYVNLSSGAKDLAVAYQSTSYARSDAIWVARWDGSPRLTGLAAVPDQTWSAHQRIKQYLGDHIETHGGRRINIDTDWVDAPVATVTQAFLLSTAAVARMAPSPAALGVASLARGTSVRVTCQTVGAKVAGSAIWDKFPDGSYVNAHDLSPTAAQLALPQCYYPYQVTAAGGLSKRSGPAATTTAHGALATGALAWVVCQRPGAKVAGTKVWDRIDSGYYVSDYYVSTRSKTTYSAPIPRC
jgi:hypothetical protein